MELKGFVVKTEGPSETEDIANALGNAVILMNKFMEMRTDIGESDDEELMRQCDIVNEMSKVLFRLSERQYAIKRHTGIQGVVLQFLMENDDKAYTIRELSTLADVSGDEMYFALMSLSQQGWVQTRTIISDRVDAVYYRLKGDR